MDGAVRAGVPEHGRLPKHYVVKVRLAELCDELGEGAPLPPERELAARFEVSRVTLQKAVRELVIDGRLQTRRGSGTFVAGPKLVQPLALTSYTEGIRSQGLEPGRRLVGLAEQPAGTELAERLRIAEGDPVIHLERVLLADGEPVGLESTYLPAARHPRLLEVLDPEQSLYACLKDRLGVVFARAEEVIETVLATPREALLIGVNPAVPMLLLHRVSYGPAGEPLERVRVMYRGDRFSFSAELRG
ncbi:GntR family transcriptional regulator [Actinomadura macrotermitis]|uniref:HTH-type transcriptional repressor DasR n=1 Tax=Actinomadura macrotermitis TaxID=2585200 RepID=A0A7K0BYZ5_9ACTN|nr:GntR family transcriptional regulator [Actinomadura macrotermitis]MQY06306.1 HTH-type transcriptional repressor DasR [Actinomadura macrotermitis]